MLDWFRVHWSLVAIPAAVLVAAIVATLWFRGVLAVRLRLSGAGVSSAGRAIGKNLRLPSFLWCILASLYLAVAVSTLSQRFKSDSYKGLGIMLLASFTMAALSLVRGLIFQFEGSLARVTLQAAWNVARVVILVFAILVLLDIVGAPVTPLIVLVALVALAALVALRDVVPELAAGLQIAASRDIKPGDYIRLSTGEEGQVVLMHARNVSVRTLDGRSITLPNSVLLRAAVINYGKPVTQAKEPFQFHTRASLPELTGLKARNLRELAAVVRDAPASAVYYHTHHFMLEQQTISPQLSNDFALFVGEVLGDDENAEVIASVDVFEFPDLLALRGRLAALIGECADKGGESRNAPIGREFHLLKAVSAILPTGFQANNLREFVLALGQVSEECLFYHMLESRMRLGKGLNDFSYWLESSLHETELAGAVARINPYYYTLSGLRKALVRQVEERIR